MYFFSHTAQRYLTIYNGNLVKSASSLSADERMQSVSRKSLQGNGVHIAWILAQHKMYSIPLIHPDLRTTSSVHSISRIIIEFRVRPFWLQPWFPGAISRVGRDCETPSFVVHSRLQSPEKCLTTQTWGDGAWCHSCHGRATAKQQAKVTSVLREALTMMSALWPGGSSCRVFSMQEAPSGASAPSSPGCPIHHPVLVPPCISQSRNPGRLPCSGMV